MELELVGDSVEQGQELAGHTMSKEQELAGDTVAQELAGGRNWR